MKPKEDIDKMTLLEYILFIDAMTTKEFCDWQGCPHPIAIGTVTQMADQFLQIDAIKHRLFVEKAKAEAKKVKVKSSVKPTKDQTFRERKLDSAYEKLFLAHEKKDEALQSFWLNELKTNFAEEFKNHAQYKDLQEIYKPKLVVVNEVEGVTESAADISAKKVEEYERENAESIEKVKEKTVPPVDGDIPMPK